MASPTPAPITPRRALLDGMRRVARAPAVLIGTYAALLGLGLPLAFVLRSLLAEHLGASLAAERAALGVNVEWWQEFQAQAVGLGTTFTPAVVGFGGVLKNLSDFIDREPLAPVLAGAIAVYLVITTFLSGGALDRLARNHATYAPAFFSACGGFFFRLLRLNVLVGLGYWILLGPVHRLLFDKAYEAWTADLTSERRAFALRVVFYVVLAAGLVALNVVADYARVRAVVEDRRSMLGALFASGRFVRRHARQISTLYTLNTACWAILVALYAVFAPGGGGGPAAIWLGLAATQVYVLGRLAIRLQFAASEIAFFQGSLAHAEYVAAPLPVWPDSPAAEALIASDDASG